MALARQHIVMLCIVTMTVIIIAIPAFDRLPAVRVPRSLLDVDLPSETTTGNGSRRLVVEEPTVLDGLESCVPPEPMRNPAHPDWTCEDTLRPDPEDGLIDQTLDKMPYTRYSQCSNSSRHEIMENVCYRTTRFNGRLFFIGPIDQAPNTTNDRWNSQVDPTLRVIGEAFQQVDAGKDWGVGSKVTWLCGTTYFFDRRAHMPNFLEGMIGLFEYFYDSRWRETLPIQRMVFNHFMPVFLSESFAPNPLTWNGTWSETLMKNHTLGMCPPGRTCFKDDFDPELDIYYPKTFKFNMACFERVIFDGIRRFVGHPDHPEYAPPPDDDEWRPEYWFSHPQMCDKFRDNIFKALEIENYEILPEARQDIKTVYLLNRTSNGRNMENYAEFEEALKARGMEMVLVAPGSDGFTSFNDQANAFSKYHILVTPHGANEANLVFMPKGALVVEFFHYTVERCDFFGSLAEVCGLEYRKVENPARTSKNCNGAQSTDDGNVSIDDLLDRIDEYLSGKDDESSASDAVVATSSEGS